MIGEKLIKLQRQFDVLKSKHPEAAPEAERYIERKCIEHMKKTGERDYD